MGEVTKYGAGYRNLANLSDHQAVFAEGRPRNIVSTIAVANGDSANSKHYFGQIPSHAIIDPRSLLYHGSITTLADYDLGLEYRGDLVTLDGLANGLNLTSAGTKSPIAAITADNYAKRLWEIIALSRDPGRVYDLVGTMKAASTADSYITMMLDFIKK